MSFPPPYTTAGEGAKPHLKLWKSKESRDELWMPSPYVSLSLYLPRVEEELGAPKGRSLCHTPPHTETS